MAEAEVEAKPIAMAPRLEGSMAKAKAKAKAKGPSWAEYHAMEKRLNSMLDKIGDLSWRLNLERIRGCFGDALVEKLFPPETRLVPPKEDYLMRDMLLLVYEVEKMDHPGRLLESDLFRRKELKLLQAGVNGVDLMRFREDQLLLLRLNLKEEKEKEKPRHVKDLYEERSRLMREYERLVSEKRDPDFSGMTEADRAAEAERLREEALEEARRLPDGRRRLEAEARARILDFDPKQGGIYYNSFNLADLIYHRSFSLADLYTFDLAEESPIGPMRFTDKVFEGEEIELTEAVNILSVKVARSDVGFPIHVYGTVIARDSIDLKRVYLFNRDREHAQLINSKDEPLILTGPKRGLALLDDNYVETDLKIKDHQGEDRELSKGILKISGIARRSLEKCEVDRLSLATRLSTVKVDYAFVISAVEATIAIEVEEGEFCGRVTADTTSIKKRLVLYDSKLADHMTGNGLGAIKMMRPVISVCFSDTLIIIARAHGGKAVSFGIAPRISNVDDVVFSLGTAKMRLRIAWSIVES